MKLVTGNDLISGLVVWWTGRDWSRFIADAVDVGSDGDAVVAREEAAQNVNTAYVTDATSGEHGPVPLNVKQSIRAFGPSVHPQFAPNVFHPPVRVERSRDTFGRATSRDLARDERTI